MTTQNELMTADRAAIIRDDWLLSDDPDTDCIPGLCASIIALHEALAAANARADQLQHIAVENQKRAEAAEVELARLKSSHQGLAKNSASNIEYWQSLTIKLEARVAVLEARAPVAWMGREGYFTTDPRQASAHAHHGTPLTPLYASAALETGAGDERHTHHRRPG